MELTGISKAFPGVWALQDTLVWPTGMRLDGYGHYHETYEKLDGEWRIKTMKLTRLRRQMSTHRAPERGHAPRDYHRVPQPARLE
jgi:hypothetical protein